MRAAVVGAGDISAIHLDALDTLATSGVEVAAVVDHDLDRAAAAAAPRGAQAFTSIEDALDEVEVDVVHVCTPHDQHLPVVLSALAAGRHVLMEKPLAHRLEDAERLAQAAAESRGKVGVCFQNRYNPTSVAMQEALSSGRLGRPLSATATVVWSRGADYYANKPWAGQRDRAGGGALINQSIHTIDLVQWLLGPVTEVTGRSYQLLPLPGVDVEDSATFTMTHAVGAEGSEAIRSTMWATNAGAVNDPVTIDIVCEHGTLALHGDLLVTGPEGSTRVTDDVAGVGQSYWGASHAALIADFYAQLDQPGPFWIDPTAALAAQRILAAVYEQSS